MRLFRISIQISFYGQARLNVITPTTGNWIIMEGTKSKTISITAKALDGANVEIRNWSQTMTINAGECKLYQLIW
jgi:hypothetical protein